jgi:hypothetical protein
MTNIAIKETALDRFYATLAYKPWCGDDKAARLVRPKALASKKSYIAPNPPAMIHWLVFDIDHNDCMIWEDKLLPSPNIIVQNPGNSKSHLYYAIDPVCISDKARQNPIRYMKAIARGLAAALNADEAYTGRIAKNPLSGFWRVTELHAHEYSLNELNEYIEPISKPFYQAQQDNDNESRNCSLFNRLRFWAYSRVKHYRYYETENFWHKSVLDYALSIATIEPDFSYNEVKNTAKSVAKWVWLNYTGDGKDRGVMKLANTDISLEAKQRLAARRTHEIRSNSTGKRLYSLIKNHIKLTGKLPTKTHLAELSGLSRQQITRRYIHLFETELYSLRKETIRQVENGAFGVHQVTACLRGSLRKSLFESTAKDQQLIYRIDQYDGGD